MFPPDPPSLTLPFYWARPTLAPRSLATAGFERPRYIGALDDSRPFYFYTRTKPLDD